MTENFLSYKVCQKLESIGIANYITEPMGYFYIVNGKMVVLTYPPNGRKAYTLQDAVWYMAIRYRACFGFTDHPDGTGRKNYSFKSYYSIGAHPHILPIRVYSGFSQDPIISLEKAISDACDICKQIEDKGAFKSLVSLKRFNNGNKSTKT